MIDVVTRPAAILRLRLANEHLLVPTLSDPRAIVAHLGAVQSQDYPAALWALGLRLQQTRFASLECAFNQGAILRTHVLRPTWHFVTPEDIRWMLALTGPRIIRGMTSRERDLGMDLALTSRAADVIVRALEGGNALTRDEIGAALRQAGIEISDPGLLSHLISRCELQALVCSGPMRGKQHTWLVLDERARSPRRDLHGEEAVGEIVARYFTSHGPATLADFAWWSGLTMGDAKRGLAAHGSRFVSTTVDGLTYWYAAATADVAFESAHSAWLLPNYDEYTVAFRFRELFHQRGPGYQPTREDSPFSNVIVIDGRVVGLWKRSVPRDPATVEPRWFASPSRAQQHAFDVAAARYAAFFGSAA